MNGAGQLNTLEAMEFLGYKPRQRRSFLESYVYGNTPAIASTKMAGDRWFWKKDLLKFIESRSYMSAEQVRESVGIK